MSNEPQFVKIVPAPSEPGKLVRTQGTLVMVGDQPLKGVYKIVLSAETNDIWRAEIHCHPQMMSFDAIAQVHYPKKWWERVIDWMVGNNDV